MRNNMRPPWYRNPTWPGLAFAFICALTLSEAGADPEITPDEARAPSAVMPQTPVDGSAAKRGLKLDYSTVRVGLQIVLPPPSEQEKQSMAKEGSKGPVAIGFHRDVPGEFKGDLSPQLDWIEQPDGSFVSSLSVTSPGAESVRVGIRAELPPGGEIRFFDEESDESLPVVTSEDFHIEGDEIQTLWSPTVEGDTIGIEITLPSEKPLSVFWLTVDAVSHTLVPTGSLPLAPKLDCPYLHIDVACRAGSIHGNLQNAVAHIVYEDDGLTWICTGTLMNDKDDDTDIPYFLTANHCVDTQAVARTVEAYWFYQNARCNVDRLDSRYARTTGGTVLLTTNTAYDLSLLRFPKTLPGGLVLSGWDANPIGHPEGVYGIHHPSGAAKSYSAGTTQGNRFSDGVTNAIHVEWSDGTTEGGSSGSGLFLRNSGRLIGGLSHGPNCGYRIVDRYGPFEDFYPQTLRWLDPDGEAPGMGDDDHGGTPADATVVRIPSTTPGSLERNGDRDYFRFALAARDNLRVFTTGATDTYGTLSRSGSVRRWQNDDGGKDVNFQISVSGAEGGTYYVEVRGYSSSTTGTYTLHVAGTAALSPPDIVIPLVTEGANRQMQGVFQVLNLSNRAGTVEFQAVDDTGIRYGPIFLPLNARASRLVSSRSLEQGNDAIGLSGGVGDGEGDWRVELRSDLDIEARAYIWTQDGILTAMHHLVEETTPGSMSYRVPLFSFAGHARRESLLRLINPGSNSVSVLIRGTDARGNRAPRGDVRLTLRGGETLLLNSSQLEGGDTGLRGRLGDGDGNWQLDISANRTLMVMSLMVSDSGNLTNLSR